MIGQLDKFLFTSETTPDVSTDLAASVARVDKLVGVADAVNITDSPNCKVRLSSLLVASEIRKNGLDVVLQLTGRDRNRIALQSDMLGAASVGVDKILCLSGDQPQEDGPLAVNECNSLGLIKLCADLSSGRLSDGSLVNSPKPIYSGAADDIYNHLAHPGSVESLRSKVSDGASFVQTQYCFDFQTIKAYSDSLMRHDEFDSCQFLVGMGPLASARQADWMRKNLWGVNIPDEVVSRLDESSDPSEEGLRICEELIELIMGLPRISGVHLMGPNCEVKSARIISRFVSERDNRALENSPLTRS